MRNYSGNKIIIANEQEELRISPVIKELVKEAINTALLYEGFMKKTEVSVTFVDDERIRELNRQYRNKDASTDVLSFPMDEDFMLGDIVISTEHAKAQAEEYGHSLKREIAFLTVHSVLHLLGWDHEKSEEEEKEMFFRQEEILNIMGITRRV